MSSAERVIEIAKEAHRGQFDKSGKDYIGHLLHYGYGKTEKEKIVGVLHDVVEDIKLAAITEVVPGSDD